jgi:restriction endonuclease S subunit
LENGFVKSEISKKEEIPREMAREVTSMVGGFLEDNDIIVSNKGTIGKTAIYKADNRLILPSPQVFVVKADTKKILPEYLFKILNSKHIQNKLKSLATGAYIPRISKKDLADIRIPVPSKKEQRKIQEKYWNLKDEIAKLEKKVQEAQKKLMEFDINE